MVSFFLMNIELVTPNEPFDDCPYPVMKTFPMTSPKKRPYHFASISHARVPTHKIPWLCAFELSSTPIWPHKMPFWAIPMLHHVLPMNLEIMLHKFKIMFVIIWYIKMIFIKYCCLLIIRAKIRVVTKTYVY